ncbi:MAG TPA: hypothetical protein ENI26_13070 [Methylophaga aminisulfidivorans]|uniref:Uncharacterized protein n=2 Tax=root TaxID=1 RepID=A0A7C1VTL8_9GAMM|nr:hypothetical protein [Methylophaga aminisulfidivorans]
MSIDEKLLKRTETLISEIDTQSDRGAAIVGVAWVEEELEAAIASFLEDDAKALKRLLGRSGPLATFSAKIDLALLLGMCSKVIAGDLHRLREIRNDFAHTIAAKDHSALTFNSENIADKCFALKCVAHENPETSRHAFSRACAVLNADFYMHGFFEHKVSTVGRIYAKFEHGN